MDSIYRRLWRYIVAILHTELGLVATGQRHVRVEPRETESPNTVARSCQSPDAPRDQDDSWMRLRQGKFLVETKFQDLGIQSL